MLFGVEPVNHLILGENLQKHQPLLNCGNFVKNLRAWSFSVQIEGHQWRSSSSKSAGNEYLNFSAVVMGWRLGINVRSISSSFKNSVSLPWVCFSYNPNNSDSSRTSVLSGLP